MTTVWVDVQYLSLKWSNETSAEAKPGFEGCKEVGSSSFSLVLPVIECIP